MQLREAEHLRAGSCAGTYIAMLTICAALLPHCCTRSLQQVKTTNAPNAGCAVLAGSESIAENCRRCASWLSIHMQSNFIAEALVIS